VPSTSGTQDATPAGTAILISLGVIAFLATVTTVQRIIHVHREARKQEQH
jgi:hypothetical protein